MAEASARPCQIELVWANPDKTGLELNETVLGPVLLAMNGGTGTTSTRSRSPSGHTQQRRQRPARREPTRTLPHAPGGESFKPAPAHTPRPPPTPPPPRGPPHV